MSGNSDSNSLLRQYETKLQKAIKHLIYSTKKVKNLSTDIENLNDADLEAWEGFVSRFSRVADLFISKYVRLRVLEEDPAFRGTVKDFLNFSEKIGLIQNADKWMKIRKLRNVIVQDYNNENLQQDLSDMREEVSLLLNLKNIIS